MAHRKGDHIVGLRFFTRKHGNEPSDSVLIEFEGMSVEQLIKELQNIKLVKRNPHTGEIIRDA